ncbi:MAG: chain length determinant protein EpsF [Rhizobacter sp.]
MNIQQFLRVLVARWWIVVLVCGVMVGVTAAITALLPRQYTATTTMVIEPRGTDALGGANLGAQMLAQTYLATQIDVLQSERVGREVVKAMGIDHNPSAIQQWRDATQGTGSIEAYFAGLLTKKLDVKPSRESSVVSLSFTGADPQFAAQVVDSFAKTYIAISLELRNQPSKVYASWFDEQLKSLRTELEQAQAKVSAYQQRNGIVANDERLDVENSRLAELSQQLVIAQSQSVDARSRSELSSASVRSVPEVGSTAVVQNLRTELLRAETRVQEASEHLGPAHPTLERMLAELASLRERLQAELNNANGSVSAVSSVFNRREVGLRAAVETQKQRVLQIKQQRDEMSTLQREAENAQRVFDIALQRLAQTRLESQNTQTNAYILNSAAVPGEPSSPKVLRNLLLSAVMGFILGLAAAFLVELVDRRIRSAADLEGGLKLPVLGSLPRAMPRRAPGAMLGWRGAPLAQQGS